MTFKVIQGHLVQFSKSDVIVGQNNHSVYRPQRVSR